MFDLLDSRDDIIQNKYYNWYKNIITFRKAVPPEGYSERHHIIPRSIGGTWQKANIVRLTAREHFICHACLARCTTGDFRHKMIFAYRRLTHSEGSNVKINSYYYEFQKNNFSKSASYFSKQRWQTSEYREKMLKSLTDNVHNNDITKKKISDSVKSLHKDPSYRENYLKQRKVCFTEDVKQNMSEKAKSRWKDPEQVNKMKQIRNRPEHKANIAEKAKARWADPNFRMKMSVIFKNRSSVRQITPVTS